MQIKTFVRYKLSLYTYILVYFESTFAPFAWRTIAWSTYLYSEVDGDQYTRYAVTCIRARRSTCFSVKHFFFSSFPLVSCETVVHRRRWYPPVFSMLPYFALYRRVAPSPWPPSTIQVSFTCSLRWPHQLLWFTLNLCQYFEN